MILTMRVNPDLFLDLEPEVTETAAAGLSLRGSQMDATIRGSDGHGKFDLFLSFSPSVNYRQHPSEVHARAAYEANNLTGGQDQRLLTHPSYRSANKCIKNSSNYYTDICGCLYSFILVYEIHWQCK